MAEGVPKNLMKTSSPVSHQSVMTTVSLLLLLTGALGVQKAVGDAQVAPLFQLWLAAFNGGNRNEISTFYREHFPSRVEIVSRLIDFRKSTGGFDLRKVEESSATKFSAIVQERDSDQFARISMEVDARSSDGIAKMMIVSIPRPDRFRPARMAEADALSEFRKRLDQWANQDKFSGAALVARDGKTIFAGAYGQADREKGTPNMLSSRFRMGSMNKMFTAVAILQLVQANKIRLDDLVGKYLPDYPNKDVASKVTIHHLLTHTGGTGDFFGPEFDMHRLELKRLKDYVKLFGSRGLSFEPGARWEYSNYGFLLLGLVVEKASRQDYYDYVRDHVFRPAGMTSSGSEPETTDIPNLSKGYMYNDGALKLNTGTLPYRGTSAGGGYSTVEDLLRFASALTSHKLLDAYHTELLVTAKVPAASGQYAYGFQIGTEDGVRSFGHGGGAPGMNGELLIFPESHYVVAVLANMDRAAGRAASWISARLPDK